MSSFRIAGVGLGVDNRSSPVVSALMSRQVSSNLSRNGAFHGFSDH
jgi:hypothetical protein